MSQVEAEQTNNMFTFQVNLNPSCSSQMVVDGAGRYWVEQYSSSEIVNSMPRDAGKEKTVHLFHVGSYLTNDELEKEFRRRNLKPATPDVLVAVNKIAPDFADTHPNLTHWMNTDGLWYFIAFDRFDSWHADIVGPKWIGLRYVCIARAPNRYHRFWWFAGVPL